MKKYDCEIVQVDIGTNEDALKNKLVFDSLKYEIMDKNTVEQNLAFIRHTYVSVCTKMYKADIAKDIRFPLNKLHEDVFVTYQYFWRSDKNICYVKEPLYIYEMNDGGITHSKYNINRLSELEGWENAAKFFEQIGFVNLKNAFLYRKQKAIKEHYTHLYIYNKGNNDKQDKLNELLEESKRIYINLKNEKIFSAKEKLGLLMFHCFPALYVHLIKLLKKFGL